MKKVLKQVSGIYRSGKSGRLLESRRWSRREVGIFAIVLGIIGLIALVLSFALTPGNGDFEAETMTVVPGIVDPTPPTPTPTPTPTPSGGGGTLKFNPDTVQTGWSNPVTINIPASGYSNGSLNNNTNYLMVLPKTAAMTGSIDTFGGKNIRIIGGYANGATLGNNPNTQKAVFNMQGVAGSVYIEGVRVDLSAQTYQDIMTIGGDNNLPPSTRPRPTVYLQHCLFIGATDDGAYHSDIFQKYSPLNGIKAYDDTLIWNYQGLFLSPQEGNGSGGWYQGGTPGNYFERVNFRAVARGSVSRQGYGLWVNWDWNSNTAQNAPNPVSHTILAETNGKVYIDSSNSGDTLGSNLVWPRVGVGTSGGDGVNGGPGTPIGMILGAGGTSGTWPTAAGIEGTIYKGTPPGGDYITSSMAGPNYVSPGYQ